MRSVLRRLLDQAGFSPRQLFAALQGAWLEPKQGYIWQENTGVTPTTTGGQTIGKIADQSGYGNNATQATAANRPVLGRRYNLLTYSEDLSQPNWVKAACTNSVNKIIPSASLAQHFTYQNVLTSGLQYTVSFIAKADGYSWLKIVSSTKYINIDTTNGLIGLSSGMSGTIAPIGGGEYQCSVTYVSSEPRSIMNVAISNNASWDSEVYAGDGTSGIQVRNVDIRLTSDVNKDPAYQRITTATDYDYGSYPTAIFDTNDSLTLSLPSINVRRNLLTYSEQFDNAAWLKLATGTALIPVVTTNVGIAPNGTATADLILFDRGAGTTSNDFARLYQSPAIVGPVSMSIWIKSLDGNPYSLVIRAGNGTKIITVTGVWERFSVGSADASANFQLWLRGDVGAASQVSVYIWGAQLELGSVATDYQKITDWTSEAFASSGSVYFATPVGMSQLNNQSMGQTYTLPALSSDIYSWMVFPQRLNAAQESKLARYMEQRAGIAGPDILWESFRYNFYKYSEQFNQSVWVKTNVTVTSDATLSPLGDSTADALYETTANAAHIIRQPVSLGTYGPLKFSFYAKPNGRTIFEATLVNGDPPYQYVQTICNISTSSVNTAVANGGVLTSATITPSANGFYLITIIGTIGTTISPNPYIQLYNDSGQSIYAGDASKGIYLMGAELRLASNADKYPAYQRIDAGPDPYTIVQEQLTADDGEQLLLAQ